MNTSLLLAGLIASSTVASAADQATTNPNQTVSAAVDAMVDALERGQPMRQGFELSVFRLDVERGTVSMVVDKVSDHLAYCGSPSWAPDGRRIVFDATPKEGFSQTQMQVIEAKDGRAMLTELGPGNCPAFSPDGQQIAFWLNGGAVPGAAAGLWLMRPDGGRRQRLPLTSSGIPKWSPDGKRLLVAAFTIPTELSLVDLTDLAQPTADAVLVEGWDFHSVPSWSGAGLAMVAVIKSKDVKDVVIVDVATPTRATVKQSLWRVVGGVSPNYPVYHAATGRCVFSGRDSKGAALYSFRTGEVPKRIEPVGYRGKIASLAFSPDGRYVLFCSEQTR